MATGTSSEFTVDYRTIAAELPLEVWAKVFAHLQPRSPSKYQPFVRVQYYDLAAQSRLCQLPSVCKSFKDVFKQHPELPCHVFLKEHFPVPLLPSLISWLQHRNTSIQSLTSACKDIQVMEEVCKALAGPWSRLAAISCKATSALQLTPWATCTRLKDCTLQAACDQGIDLTPLQALLELESLRLCSGSFYNMSAPKHLTALDIANCDIVTGGLGFVQTLLKLRVHKSQIKIISDPSLYACALLHTLDLVDCSILATGLDENIVIQTTLDMSISDKLSCLRCLTHLTIDIRSQSSHLDMQWLYQLTGLEHLQLKVCANVDLDERLQALSRLSVLSVETSRKPVWVLFAFDWCALTALQSVSICVDHFQCSTKMLALTKLKCLKAFTFQGTPSGYATACIWSVLLYRLAGLRPDVVCEIA